MSNVVQFTKRVPKDNAKVISVLEDALLQAKEGKVDGIFCILQTPEVFTSYIEADQGLLAWAMAYAQVKFNDSVQTHYGVTR